MTKLADNKPDLRILPPVSDVLATDAAAEIGEAGGQRHLSDLARAAVDSLRSELNSPDGAGMLAFVSREELLEEAVRRLRAAWRADQNAGIRKVINATGVIVHTNLGRAPLSADAVKALAETAAGYCTLEYDIEKGSRGKRGARAEALLAELTGAEAAVIVNNCAAAAFFILTVFAKGGEAIVSRGELVEIGGDFRIPDVLKQSGTKLIEIGTTNRTRISDYENAIGPDTAVLLKVHTSNYKIIGFTEAPPLKALAELADQQGILLYEDAGSGAIADLGAFGLGDEPNIGRSVSDGAHLVSFSGDKLLGGPQAGLIVGKAELIEKLRMHPLYRALRVDKLIYAALEATLDAYRRGSEQSDIPVLKMLSANKEDLEARTAKFVERLAGLNGLKAEISTSEMAVGGGAAPGVNPETPVAVLSHEDLSAVEIEKRLRSTQPAVIARIADDKLLVDLRTVDERDDVLLARALENAMNDVVQV